MINYLSNKRAASQEQWLRDKQAFMAAADVALEPHEYARIERLFPPALQAEYRARQRRLMNEFALRGIRAVLEPDPQNEQTSTP